MCAACSPIDWLAPQRSVLEELTEQSARLGSTRCPNCRELELEIEQLRDELRGMQDDNYRRWDDESL